MSKVTKKIGKILLHSLSGVVFVAILLVLVVALIFSLPRVQTFVASELTEHFSELLGTKLSIESVAIERLSQLSAKGVYIEDLNGDTLIYANRATGRIDRDALLKEAKIKPYDLCVQDGGIFLKTTASSSNINDVIFRLKKIFPADPTKKTHFALNDVKAKDFHFKLYNERTVGRAQAGSIDYADMDIRIAEAKFDSIVIDGKDVSFYNMFTTKALDKSGALLENSSFGRLTVGIAKVDFEDIDFRSEGSHLILP